jgi:inhibitor of KinA
MGFTDTYTVYSLGDSALTLDFGNCINRETNSKVLEFFHIAEQTKPIGILDIIPAYSSVTVVYDIVALRIKGRSAFEVVVEWITGTLAGAAEDRQSAGRQLNVPVCYSPSFGLDLNEMAKEKKISPEELVRLHSSRKYHVYMVGFLPGFPYMGEVDEQIATARKSKPRISVPAGSVGIAGKQTGIYPLDSPGGWQIIGRTPLPLFYKHKKEAVFFQPGDEVTFYSITEDEFEDYQDRPS